MKRIEHSGRARDKLLHIETDGCIVNIRVGLTNTEGQRVTSIEILPDGEGRGGDGEGGIWQLAPECVSNNRVIRIQTPETDATETPGEKP